MSEYKYSVIHFKRFINLGEGNKEKGILLYHLYCKASIKIPLRIGDHHWITAHRRLSFLTAETQVEKSKNLFNFVVLYFSHRRSILQLQKTYSSTP